MNSFFRLRAIAQHTLMELIRQKVLILLLLFALAVIASSNLFKMFTFEEQIQFLKDFCLGAMTLFGMILAILGTAQLLPQESENRTLITLLAKPVHRWEVLVGKFIGVAGLLFIATTLLSLCTLALLRNAEPSAPLLTANLTTPEQMAIESENRAAILAQTRDPHLPQAFLLVYAKALLTASITLLLSTFSTSPLFTASISFLIYLIGHLQGTAREYWLSQSNTLTIFPKIILGIIALVFPDLGAFSIIEEIAIGNSIPWIRVLDLTLYALTYTGGFLVVGALIFEKREL